MENLPSNKPIISKTAPKAVEHSVRFQPWRFKSLVFDKGYDVYVDRALRCPCVVESTGQALTDCNNCLGTGWIFVDRKETRLVLQGMGMEKKYENWSEINIGSARVTYNPEDNLAYMDRIILKDVEGHFNETQPIVDYDNNKTVFLIY